MRRIKNECQKRLDRCWNALPEKCPMRQRNRKRFDEVWGNWDPVATATVDPNFKKKFSILLAEFLTENRAQKTPLGTHEESVSDIYRPYTKNTTEEASGITDDEGFILEHYAWLLKEGTVEDLADWNEEVLGCINNMQHGRNEKLIILLQVALGVPHEEGRYATFDRKPYHDEESKEAYAKEQAKLREMRDWLADEAKDTKAARKVYQSFQKKPPGELNTCAPIDVTQYKIKEECKKVNPDLFLALSPDSWDEIFELATIHWRGDFPKRRPGTTPRKGG